MFLRLFRGHERALNVADVWAATLARHNQAELYLGPLYGYLSYYYNNHKPFEPVYVNVLPPFQLWLLATR